MLFLLTVVKIFLQTVSHTGNMPVHPENIHAAVVLEIRSRKDSVCSGQVKARRETLIEIFRRLFRKIDDCGGISEFVPFQIIIQARTGAPIMAVGGSRAGPMTLFMI